MIRFERKDKSVKIEIEVNVPHANGRLFWAYWEAGSEWAAGMLTDLFYRQLGERVKSIRQKAYDRGWADAKAKRARSTQYMTTLNDV